MCTSIEGSYWTFKVFIFCPLSQYTSTFKFNLVLLNYYFGLLKSIRTVSFCQKKKKKKLKRGHTEHWQCLRSDTYVNEESVDKRLNTVSSIIWCILSRRYIRCKYLYIDKQYIDTIFTIYIVVQRKKKSRKI